MTDQTSNGGPIAIFSARLTAERLLRGLTIEQLAETAGVSSGLLSQLERGIGNPSLRTLQKLGEALELPLLRFFSGNAHDQEIVVRAKDRKQLVVDDPDLQYQLLVPDLNGALSMLRVVLPARFSNEDQPFQHTGEECEVILSGSCDFFVGDRSFTLEEGDSVRFDSRIPHWFRIFDEPVVLISAQTPPSF